MNRIWPKLKKLLYPGLPWVILLALLGSVLLFLTFIRGLEETPFAYVSYVLSAYALTIAVAEAVVLGKAIRRKLYDTPLTNRYLTDAFFRVRAGLQLSLLVSLFYAGLRLINAVIYSSFWEGALAFYYILLCGVRVNLIRQVPASSDAADYGKELRTYRATGALLMILDIALGGIAVQIVRKGHSYNYAGYLIFVMGFYAFYCLILSSVNTVKYRKFKSPVLSAAKAVNLTTALVSMFSLETAMVNRFGEDTQFRDFMTAATAFAVCALVLVIAAYMVIRSGQTLKGLKTT
nr:hypothetical protein [uncultured Oscillibacter sp.]